MNIVYFKADQKIELESFKDLYKSLYEEVL